MEMFSRLVFLFVCLTLISCGPYKPLYISPEFTHEKIWQERIAFGGVSSITKWSTPKVIWRSRYLSDHLNSKESFLKTVSFDEYLQKVGVDNFVSINMEYSERKGLSSESLTKLSKVLPNIRYVIFYSIDSDKVEKDSDHWTEYKTEEKNGIDVIETEYYYSYDTTRNITVRSSIYDLKSRQIAWNDISDVFDVESNDCEEHQYNTNCSQLLRRSHPERFPTEKPALTLLQTINSRLQMGIPKPCDTRNGGLACSKLRMKLRKEWD